MLGTSSSAFEGIFKEHFTILLAHVEQNSAVINLVSAVKNGSLSVGGGLVKSNPLTLLCHLLRNPQNQDYATMNAFSTRGSEICPLSGITFLTYLFMLQSSIFKPLWMTRVVTITSSFLTREGNILAYNGNTCILFTILSPSVGRVARTSTIPSAWLLLVTSDPWERIDGRHTGQLSPSPECRSSVGDWSELEFANAAIFIAAFVLISLGYFIGLSKSSLIPAQVVKFLGFLCLPFDRGSEY